MIIDFFTTDTHHITLPPGGLPDTYPLPPRGRAQRLLASVNQIRGTSRLHLK